jgi:UDP-glucose 4-epimerase
MSVLITGGLGYIGSHIALELMNQGLFDVIVIDNLSNSKIEKLNKIETLNKKIKHFFFHEVELLDYNKLVDVFSKYKIKIVIHMAGLKSVN